MELDEYEIHMQKIEATLFHHEVWSSNVQNKAMSQIVWESCVQSIQKRKNHISIMSSRREKGKMRSH